MDGSTRLSDTEERIYSAATELFFKYGYHGTTLRMLSEVVRVKTPSIYYHVGNKQALLFTIMSRTLEEISQEVRLAIEQEDEAAAKLKRAVETHIKIHATRQREVFIADSEVRALEDPYRGKVLELRDNYEDIYKTLLTACVRDAKTSTPNVDLKSYAILSMCTGVAQWYRPDGRYTLDQISVEYVSFILSGLGIDEP